jgi:hypothetical protein
MKMMNKKAISAIVATVLIILITVAAVTIIWQAIIPMIKQQTIGSTICLDAVSQISLESAEGYTCWDQENAIVKIQVSRGAEEFDLIKLQVSIYEGGSSDSSKIPVSGLEDGSKNLEPNEDKVYEIPYESKTEEGPSRVEIAPIVSIGDAEKTCEIASESEISPC